MKNVKFVFAAIGGATLVGLLIVGWLVFSAFGRRGEARDEYEAACSTRTRLNASTVPLTAETEARLKKNADVYRAWTDEAARCASRGDRPASTNLTAASFKQRLVDEAFELRRLPGADGPLVDEGFAFGFVDYITGGKIPEAVQLVRLERRWTDIRLLTELFSTNGVAKLTDIVIVEKKADEKKSAVKSASKDKSKKNAKKGAKKGSAEDGEAEKTTAESYEIRLKVSPAALVRVLKALASDSRFIIVDSFSFARPVDQVMNKLGDSKKESAEKQGTNRKRGRKRLVEAKEESDESKEEDKDKGFVVDPEKEAPFDLTLTLTVLDFGHPQTEE